MQEEADRRIGRGRRPRGSTCCRPGCFQPRVPPAAFCDSCLSEGYVEDAA
jgi:hypothetical protein